jgi:inner membrane protein
MPSPLAHALAGAAAYAVLAPGARPRSEWRPWAAAAFAAVAADLDFLPGLLVGDPSRYHHGVTHSLAATLVFTLLLTPLASSLGLGSPRRAALLLGTAYGSHLLLDYLTVDTTRPYGIPVFWPLSTQHFIAPVLVFTDLYHGASWAAFVNWHNVVAMVTEALVVGIPVVGLCLWRLAPGRARGPVDLDAATAGGR